MGNKCLKCQFCCAAARILCYQFCCCCLHKKSVAKRELDLIVLGLENAGKSHLLATLCSETTDDIQPTKGFSLKDISTERYILHTKEIGGSEKIRKYWKHYLNRTDGILYLISANDINNEEKMNLNYIALHDIMLEEAVLKRPLLVLINIYTASELTGVIEKVKVKLKLDDFEENGLIVNVINDVLDTRDILQDFADLMTRRIETGGVEINRI